MTAVDAPVRALALGMQWGGERSGGLDRVFSDLCKSLPHENVRVRGVVAGPQDASTLSNGAALAFASADSLPKRLMSCRKLCLQLMSDESYDLVAAHFCLYAASILDRLGRRPFVMHFHGPWAAESAREQQSRMAVAVKERIEKEVYRRAGAVIVLSKAFANLLEASYAVPAGKIHIVPGAVDIDRFNCTLTRKEARAALGWPLDRPIILTVRRLIRRTGVELLIEAMEEAGPALRDAMLIVAGTGPQAQFLQGMARELLPSNNVRFTGYLPDELLPIAYRAADINAVPSLALEGFGLTAAEALAAGTPSIVTPVGGLPEVVARLSPALVSESATPRALASTLIAALDGASPLPSSDQCRKYAQDNFTSALAAKRTAGVYRSCL